jgi:hypothetical protein
MIKEYIHSFFTFAIKYTPLPTAFSTPYNISDLFTEGELAGGRGGIEAAVTLIQNAIAIYKRISLMALVF